jgi:WD40 repeat protein
MKHPRLWFALIVLGLTLALDGQRKEEDLARVYPYRPAFISTISARPGHTELVVFPLDGKAFKIPIHDAAGPFAYSSDGKALYGKCTPDLGTPDEPIKVALCKIEFNPTRQSTVPGSTGLGVGDIAISGHQDKILVAGAYRTGLNVLRGLFELSLPSGAVRQLLREQGPTSASNPASWWGGLSISPDGKRAMAAHNHRLWLIDLDHDTTTPLDGGLMMAAWSPDGKWLAVGEDEGKKTVLLDAATFSHRRTLGTSDLVWSPDSRYLLGVDDHCGSYYGTLVMIDIESGKRTIIESSKCKINQATTGWVSNSIRP